MDTHHLLIIIGRTAHRRPLGTRNDTKEVGRFLYRREKAKQACMGDREVSPGGPGSKKERIGRTLCASHASRANGKDRKNKTILVECRFGVRTVPHVESHRRSYYSKNEISFFPGSLKSRSASMCDTPVLAEL